MLNANRLGYRLPVFEFGLSYAWWGSFCLWHLLAIVLPIRRVSGVFVQPLSGWELLIVVLFVVGVASLFRISAIRLEVRTNWLGQRMIAILPTIASLLIVGAVPVFASPVFLVVVAWGVLIASETAWLVRNASVWQVVRSAVRPAARPSLVEEFTGVPSMDGESLPAGVTQQLVRSRHDGGESLCGLLRVDFPIGERTQFVHTPFCPPFADKPETHVAQVSGPPVSVKIAQAETFGMRIEVKRNQADSEPQSVVLEIEATAETDT